MAVSINRTTKEVIYGRDAKGLNPATWLIFRPRPKVPGPGMENPPAVAEIAALLVAGVPERFRVIDEPPGADVQVREMTPAEKSVVENSAPVLALIRVQAIGNVRSAVIAHLNMRNYGDTIREQLGAILAAAERPPVNAARVAYLAPWRAFVASVYVLGAGAEASILGAPGAPGVRAAVAALPAALAALVDPLVTPAGVP